MNKNKDLVLLRLNKNSQFFYFFAMRCISKIALSREAYQLRFLKSSQANGLPVDFFKKMKSR